MICEIDGWVLGGMQFGVLVWGAGAGAVGGAGVDAGCGRIFARLTGAVGGAGAAGGGGGGDFCKIGGVRRAVGHCSWKF